MEENNKKSFAIEIDIKDIRSRSKSRTRDTSGNIIENDPEVKQRLE